MEGGDRRMVSMLYYVIIACALTISCPMLPLNWISSLFFSRRGLLACSSRNEGNRSIKRQRERGRKTHVVLGVAEAMVVS